VVAPPLDSHCEGPVTYPGDTKILVKSSKGTELFYQFLLPENNKLIESCYRRFVLSLGEIKQDLIPDSGKEFCTASIQTESVTHTAHKWPALVKNKYSFLRFLVILELSIKNGYNFILTG